MSKHHHDLQPGEQVSIETLTILRKHQFEKQAREHSDEVEADQDDESASTSEKGKVRKAKRSGDSGFSATSALA